MEWRIWSVAAGVDVLRSPRNLDRRGTTRMGSRVDVIDLMKSELMSRVKRKELAVL